MKYLLIATLLALAASVPVRAQELEVLESEVGDENLIELLEPEAASESAQDASAAASIVRKITEKSSDLTENQGTAQGKLERLILSNQIEQLNVVNFLRFSIQNAVQKGMPANTIVLVLLFPVITAMIAASRHLVGLRGFGIFTPAIVAVALLATGIVVGFVLLFVIVVIATLARMVIKKLKLPYMPRTSLMLWVVAMTVLGTLLIAPYLGFETVSKLSIFPILLMVLLAETFMDVQTKRSRSEAIEMTLETLLLATVSYFVMNLEIVQEFVILNPEAVMVGVVVFNVFLGKFGGLRIMEYWRFRRLIN